MNRIGVLLLAFVVSTLFLADSQSDAQALQNNCLPLDYKCQENQRTDCEAWDYLCEDLVKDCSWWNAECASDTPATRSNNSSRVPVTYTEEVSCTLVLVEQFGAVSGFCQPTIWANLDYCVVDKVDMWDPYTVDFLCTKQKPGLMSTSSTDEIKLTNLGTSTVSFQEPYWLLCDYGMGSFKTDKHCYDTDYSDGDQWDVLCKEDKRLNRIYEHPNTYVWFVCSGY